MEKVNECSIAKVLFLVFWSLFLASKVCAQSYPAPSMVAPASGAVVVQSSQNPCFSWTPVSDSRFTSYVITVSLSTDFPSQRWAYDVLSSSTTSVCWNGGSGWSPKGANALPVSEAMKIGVTYYWRALATYNGASTVVGTDVTGIPFTISAPPKPTPSLISPSDGATVYSSSQNPCFSWTMTNDPTFSYYTITVSTTPNFPTTRWATQIYSISTTNICWNNGAGWGAYGASPPPAAGPLANGVMYYWRVLATFSDGTLTGNSFVGRTFLHQVAASNLTTYYQYDELGRIKIVTHPNGLKNSYIYDKADNRTTKETTN